ncbi:glycosyltransferase [Paraflavisolibacter sp. H34]|uniref:glycosyltransferase n=1 Tax=Huijunlia imazamoxiresistens TaxID=3127457 RepID=UPI00301A11BA
MVFILAIDYGYIRMATAVINGLNHYHHLPRIIVYTLKADTEKIADHFKRSANVEVIEFTDGGLHYGQWHPLIWAKIEAFRLDIQETVLFLDADMIIYSNLQKYFDDFTASKKLIGASPDFAPFVKQFNSGFDFRQFFFRHFFNSNNYLMEAAFNAGALLFRPDKAVYQELMALARAFHEVAFYPEQAILNLLCLQRDGWHRMDDLSIMPFSPRILSGKDYGMLHFFTPRPAVMQAPIIRDGEPGLQEMMAWFEECYGVPYPLEKIEDDFKRRLENTWSVPDHPRSFPGMPNIALPPVKNLQAAFDI